jgi:hypothetical protein
VRILCECTFVFPIHNKGQIFRKLTHFKLPTILRYNCSCTQQWAALPLCTQHLRLACSHRHEGCWCWRRPWSGCLLSGKDCAVADSQDLTTVGAREVVSIARLGRRSVTGISIRWHGDGTHHIAEFILGCWHPGWSRSYFWRDRCLAGTDSDGWVHSH